MKTLPRCTWGSFCALVIFASVPAIAQEQDPVVATRGGSVLPKQDRKIQPFDTITIEVFGEKDLSGAYRVQASGSIKYPLLEKVSVGGKTAAEVADDLEKSLEKDYLVHPQVTVTVKEYAARTINVTGQVSKGGSFQLPGETKWTILDAISAAGGFTKEGKKNRIEFTRNGETKTFSFNQLRNVKDPKKLIILEPGDMINVPEKFF